ncbi:LytTR family DNA-binding domain-containing protein [Staphylococcus pasteuri]|uniref:LytTR family DNA-binding domain-containing protein n=1 Tax=Staphylococcus TaxID=1279 RepID=UPI001E5FD2DF|nr:LytTR family DNA-binding domain-containing protein [Staphylococcus pasteuri]MCD9067641.1 LytTR family transcriptional regulator DNA-binding domain-containing protein [Staphylococcus pasteuri]MCO0861312.1 LytTR family transcriptional regulator DNA-binding domain-containing protein [Staphylococcus pasteuri]MCO5360418.1 LytTR family transcriptional regulator DNA-binding domain-containing protein [Staphylococcus pasteuri]MEB6613044.1 LytTR family transcriptional regulator DNA-binding domain-cont
MVQLKLFISPKEKERFVEIHSPSMDNDINHIIEAVQNIEKLTEINGRQEEDIYNLKIENITTFRTFNKQVIAITKGEIYYIKYRLYELEQHLPTSFIRISKSEIVNRDAIIKLQLEPNGLIRIYLNNLDNDFTYSSRRYLKSIKERLSL